jgi:hypothetical protein
MAVPESDGITRIWSDCPDVMLLPTIVTNEMLDLDRLPEIGTDLLDIGWCWFWMVVDVVDA